MGSQPDVWRISVNPVWFRYYARSPYSTGKVKMAPKSPIRLLLAAAALVLALVAAGCGGSSDSDDRIALVAYSTPKEAYAKLTEAFKKTPDGEGVDFDQ